MPLIEQLVYEQATQKCRTAITPRKNKGLQDWLRVCRELGGPLTNAGLAAAILQTQKRPSTSKQRACFNCGKIGHLKKNCPLPERARVATLCSRCGKGYHKASECRSIRDMKGRLLPPISESDNRLPKKWGCGPPIPGPSQIWELVYQKPEQLRGNEPKGVSGPAELGGMVCTAGRIVLGSGGGCKASASIYVLLADCKFPISGPNLSPNSSGVWLCVCISS